MDPITMFVLWSVLKGGGAQASPAWPTPQDPPPVPPRGKAQKRRRAPPPSPALTPATTPDAAPPVPAPVAPPKADQPADTKGSAAMQATPVLTLQKLINRLGAKPALKPDGLFGPKTVTAWRSIATSRGLNPKIERLSPKSADVARNTYARLNASTVTGVYDRPLYIP